MAKFAAQNIAIRPFYNRPGESKDSVTQALLHTNDLWAPML